MTSGTPHISKDLEAALEDVRQVRSYVDRLRLSHPIREVIKPLMNFALAFGPIMVVYGVGMQWLWDAPQSQILGMAKTHLIALVTVALLVLSGVVKYLVFTVASRRRGLDFTGVFRRMLLGDGYIRIIGSVIPVLLVTCAVFVQLGHAHLIVSMIGLCSGAILILIPLAIPLPELTWLGVMMLILSGISMFVYPAYVFYKVAVLFGGLCILMGFVGFRSPDEAD